MVIAFFTILGFSARTHVFRIGTTDGFRFYFGTSDVSTLTISQATSYLFPARGALTSGRGIRIWILLGYLTNSAVNYV